MSSLHSHVMCAPELKMAEALRQQDCLQEKELAVS